MLSEFFNRSRSPLIECSLSHLLSAAIDTETTTRNIRDLETGRRIQLQHWVNIARHHLNQSIIRQCSNHRGRSNFHFLYFLFTNVPPQLVYRSRDGLPHLITCGEPPQFLERALEITECIRSQYQVALGSIALLVRLTSPFQFGLKLILCFSTGLALYRALLRQCSPSAAAGNAPWRDDTEFLVKQRFRRYKKLQSPSQIANALKAGYEVRIGKGYQSISTILICSIST